MATTDKHHVVIIGGGFGGLKVAQSLRSARIRVTLIDRRNFHLFQPLLYQVATGGLSPANIAAPLRGILRRQRNASVLLGDVIGVDPEDRKVRMADRELTYDTLVVATGVRHSYFGNDQWERHAPGLKTIEDATEMRRRTLTAFEMAELKPESAAEEGWLTFVVVGAGPTGVELAGTLGELSRHTLRNNFRKIDPADARILLVEGADRVLPPYPVELSASARRALDRLGVEVRTECRVVDVNQNRVTVQTAELEETIKTRTVFWAAGVQASSLGKTVAAATNAETDRLGRIIVQSDCTVSEYPDIFVIGDLAHFQVGTDSPLPGVAPVAIQQGKYVARVIQRRLQNKENSSFRYKNLGMMATIGRAAAVADIGGFHFRGFIAWMLWLFVHLITLVGFESRLLVLLQWAWNYVTRNRAARLIAGEQALASQADETSETVQE